MLTPDDIRNILSALPEDLAKRVDEQKMGIAVGWDPMNRTVPEPRRGYPGCGGGAIYLYAHSGDLETGDFIPADKGTADVWRQVEAFVLAMERGRDALKDKK